MPPRSQIRTPDQRLRVFISSTLQELATERVAVRDAVARLHLTPVMFEAGARAHPPRELYRAYLEQSDVFVAVYWNRYGWVAPGETLSGLEDEYVLSEGMPRLVYIKRSVEREARLDEMLTRLRARDDLSFRPFSDADELRTLVADDLALMLTERFAEARAGARPGHASEQHAPSPAPASPALAADRLAAPPDESGPLIGRDALIAEIEGTLQLPDARFVTLTGTGGCGKTALAVHLAHRLLTRFPDGVFHVPLAGVRDPSAVVQAVVSTLEVPLPRGGGEPAALLASFLRGKQALLVLDNFEQVLDAAPELARALAPCRALRVLVTSRTPLHLRGEREIAVPPLSADATGATEAPAIVLFEARARAVLPSFRVDQDNHAAIAEICRRLDGLPLALELAAARVRVLTPHAMLARLDKALGLLVGGARDLPARQQTLRGAFEWSYELLSAEERALFARLGALQPGFGLDAAEAAGGELPGRDEPIGDALSGLESLVEKSLVVRGEALGEPRFRLLETAREFALEKLAASGDEPAARARIASWGEHAARELFRAAFESQPAWRDRFVVEEPQLRAVLSWTAQPGGDLQLGWRMLAKLGLTYLGMARLRETAAWVSRLRAAGACTDELVRLEVDVAQGLAAGSASDAASAFALLDGAADRLRAAGNTALAVWAEVGLTGPRLARGDQSAVPSLLRALDEAQQGGFVMMEAAVRVNLTVALMALGDSAGATAHAHATLALCSRHRNEEMMPAAVSMVGRMAFAAGDVASARAHLANAVAIAKASGNPWGGSMSLVTLASITVATGDAQDAVGLLEQALAWLRPAGPGSGVELIAGALASLAVREGDRERAQDLFRIVPDGYEDDATNADLQLLDLAGGLRAAIRSARAVLGPDARCAPDRHAIYDDVLDRALGRAVTQRAPAEG